ncbi:hypothetical protein [Phocaeicola faecalis]|uniref:hypothetical protein n=1 Tax=Phocaeicola faecalis TaxID=2786956 RepID=UPI001F25CF4D|nr:hypothetical protein [Phocaeicola faecalis]
MNKIKNKEYVIPTREVFIIYYYCNRTCVISVDDFLNLVETQIRLDFNSFKKSQIILLEDDFNNFISDCNITDNIVNTYKYEEDWSLTYDFIETNNHFILREWETTA